MKNKAKLATFVAAGFLAFSAPAMAEDSKNSAPANAQEASQSQAATEVNDDSQGTQGGWARWCDLIPPSCIHAN